MFFKRLDILVDNRTKKSGLYVVETVEHDKILIFSCDTANLFWVPDFFYRLATTEEIEALHRIDRERPISRKRKRKLQKLGKTVYWSKRLESYVYVMGQG